MKTLDLAKPMQCRSGHAVEILRTDLKGKQRIAGVVKLQDGDELVYTWLENGSFLADRESGLDLINVPDAPYEVRVAGPDDVIPMPDEISALRYADSVNKAFLEYHLQNPGKEVILHIATVHARPAVLEEPAKCLPPPP